MCLNFVQGGGCYATGEECLLGLRGTSASNEASDCELHGRFDVWVTQNNELLVTDMGFPAEEPKQCLALGINETLARKIAEDRAKQSQSQITTTQRRCFNCRMPYWISEHEYSSGLRKIGQGYLCPNCINDGGKADLEKKLGILRYWCG